MSDVTGTTFRRPPSRFRDWVSADGSTAYPGGARALPPLRLVGVPVGAPDRDRAATEGARGRDRHVRRRPDPRRPRLGVHRRRVHGSRQRLRATSPRPTSARTRPTTAASACPCCGTRRRAGSSTTSPRDVLRMFTTGFGHLATRTADLWPEPHREAIDELNDAPLRGGQQRRLRGRLLDGPGRLRARRCTACSRPSTSSTRGWRRGASCSATRRWRRTGGCSPRCCASTPSTSSTSSAACGGSSSTRTCGRTRETSSSSRCIADTVRFDEIRRHYYRTHPMINPSGIVAVRPDADFEAPHERARLGEPRVVRA